jgi:hypothetical protein
MVFGTSNAEQMRLTSTGLGIGTSSPGAKLGVLSADGATTSIVAGATGKLRTFGYADATRGALIDSINTAENTYLPLTLNGSSLLLQTGATTRATLDSSGNLGLGVTPNTWTGTGVKAFQFQNGALAASNTFGTALSFNAYYDNGWKYVSTGATAGRYLIEGNAHSWSTAPSGTAGNAISFTQALTLTADGILLLGATSRQANESMRIGTNGVQNALLIGNSSQNNGAFLGAFNDAALLGVNRNPSSGTFINTSNRATDIVIVGSSTDSYISFETATAANTAPTERARIDSSGNLLVGTTSNTNSAKVFSLATSSGPAFASQGYSGDISNPAALFGKFDNDSTTSQVLVRFTINNNSAGSGQINADGANSAAFGSFSDSRLKENITELAPQLGNIMALRPVEFDYIESEGGGHQTGFIAQEMQEVYPDAVGERAPDGMLTITGWSKTEARLVKAIQEQQAIINSLKARLDAANL